MKAKLFRLILAAVSAALLAAPANAQLVNRPPAGVYVISASATVLAAPVDATTYFFGLQSAAPDTTAAVTRVFIQRAGTIRKVRLSIRNTGVAGTAEASTASIRINNTTDTTISAAVTTNATFQTFTANVGINVIDGDYFEIKWVTPTWVTNPTNLFLWAQVYIE